MSPTGWMVDLVVHKSHLTKGMMIGGSPATRHDFWLKNHQLEMVPISIGSLWDEEIIGVFFAVIH